MNTTPANNQCQINIGASTVTVTGTTLTLRISVRFLPAFVGLRNIYGSATDAPGSVSPASLLATLTIGTVNVTPNIGSFSPTGGTGATATFTIPFSDGNGAADLNVLQVLINGSLDGRNSCSFAYLRSANTLYSDERCRVGSAPGAGLERFWVDCASALAKN